VFWLYNKARPNKKAAEFPQLSLFYLLFIFVKSFI
jgi:hypothetical protein